MVLLPANLKDSIEKNKSEWLEITQKGKLDYHERQFQTPYRSTVLFCDWLKLLGVLTPHEELEIADIGAGGGEYTLYGKAISKL